MATEYNSNLKNGGNHLKSSILTVTTFNSKISNCDDYISLFNVSTTLTSTLIKYISSYKKISLCTSIFASLLLLVSSSIMLQINVQTNCTY